MQNLATGMVTTSSLPTPDGGVYNPCKVLRWWEIAADFQNRDRPDHRWRKKRLQPAESDRRNLHRSWKKGYFVSDYNQLPLSDIVPVTGQNFALFHCC